MILNMKTKVSIVVYFVIINIFFLTACTEYEEVLDCNMSGTVTEFGSNYLYAGRMFMMYIDVDTDPDNDNHVQRFEGIFPGGELHYSYDISDVEPGSYYIYMMIDLGKGFTNVGFYGAEPMPWDVPPSPNVYLKCRTVLDWEIYDKLSALR